MTKKRTDTDLPRHAEAQPGAEIEMRVREDGGVSVDFSDGSEALDVSRREFMRITGVAAATAAMAGSACRNPEERIVPYVDRPEEIRIGQPQAYMSVCPGCSSQCGVMVTTRAGRPIKLEGNADHPASKGALCARGQASYMNLYDPDRWETPARRTGGDTFEETSWESLDRAVIEALTKIKTGGGVRLLTRTTTGSAQQALYDEIVDALPNAKHYQYEPLTSEAVSLASELSYGDRHIPHYRFDKAQYVVSLGSDFLGTWLSPVEFTKQFSQTRDPGDDMSRLVAFEGHLTLTGANADDRFRVRYAHLPWVGLALAHVVASEVSTPVARQAAGALSDFTPEAVGEAIGLEPAVLQKIGAELASYVGNSIVVAGGQASSTEVGVALEAVVNLLNAMLQNEGVTVERSRPSRQARGTYADLVALVAEIDAGKVDVLIIGETNPVYSAPPELGVAEAIEKVPLVIMADDRVTETAVFADWLATAGHELESWSDSSPFGGVFSVRQPAIRPLFDTRSLEESLLVWFGRSGVVEGFEPFLTEAPVPPGNRPGGGYKPYDPGAWYRFIQHHWKTELHPRASGVADFPDFWEAVLRKGVWEMPGFEQPVAPFDARTTLAAVPSTLPEKVASEAGDLSTKELFCFASIPLYDGRWANNGHLQELPHAITKHSWGSYVCVSPNTFKAAGLELGDELAVTATLPNGDEVTRHFPVIMQPGMHDDVISVPLGYGRERAGVVGSDVGENAFLYSRGVDGRQIMAGFMVSAKPTGENLGLSIAQGAHIIDPSFRQTVLATTTLAAFKHDEGAGVHVPPPMKDLWEQHDYGTLKWGMSIDMTKCTGCNACVVACQEENNIPVVGRQGVMEGREMYWLRIDRYYKLPKPAADLREHSSLWDEMDDPMYDEHPYVGYSEYMDNPRVLMQPMLCQHCENAPCETVCPVLATMHSSDGLNQMAYNRCVGTRYCSNNCPYKVRRFNWYNYSEDRSDSFLARIFPELEEHARLNVSDPLPMGFNPEVIVRSRGVMEKCTFCVHRIRRAKWQMREEGRSIMRDGDVVTACQQTCPADAIKFGNLLDEESIVSLHHRNKRAVQPLGELNTESSIAYLSAVWNTEADPMEEPFNPNAAEHGAGGDEAGEH